MEVEKLQRLDREVERRRGEIALLSEQLEETQKQKEEAQHKKELFEEAREIVSTVLAGTQEQVKGSIEEIVSIALSTIYGENYFFRLRVEIKRNQTEMTPIVVIDDEEFSLKSDLGGGIVDVVSFTLRLSLWMLSFPRGRPFFLLDEPFKYVSKDKLPRIKSMLEELVKIFQLQIVLVSHEKELIECAESAYQVSLADGTSLVERIK